MSDADSSSRHSVTSILRAAKRSLDESNIPINQRQQFLSAIADFFTEDTDSFRTKLPRRDIPAWDAAIRAVRQYIESLPAGDSEPSPDSEHEGNGSAGERLHQLISNSPKNSFKSRVQNFASGLGLSTQSLIDDEKESGSEKPNVVDEEEEEEEEEDALEQPDDDLVQITLTRKQWVLLQARIKEADEAETITIKDVPESEDDEQKVTDTDEEPHQSGNEASDEGLGISD
jgi:hypothetical protein